MSYEVKQGNIFGRIGKGIGKGLSEQIPKEIEHQRLRSGLKNLAEKSGKLSPEEYLAEAAGTYGITPQMIQSFGELAKQRNQRNAFRQGAPNETQGMESTSPSQPQGQEMGGQPGISNLPQNQQQGLPNQERGIPSDFATRGAEAKAQPGIVTENPIQNKFIPAIPWTPAQRDADISREWDRNPTLSYEQIVQRSADNEQRYLNSPQSFRDQQDYLKGQEELAESELDKMLSTSLQKEGKDIYSDLTGDTLINMKKAMKNDLATDPSLTPKTAAEKWVKKGKDFVETKNLVKTLANRDMWDKLAPNKKEETLKRLKEAQKIYDDMGSKREFYNMLKSNNKPPVFETNKDGIRKMIEPAEFGFGASPGYAALIAYPRSEPLKKVIKNAKIPNVYGYGGKFDPDYPAKSRKVAEDFSKNRTGSDSILAFAREMKDTYPLFDEVSFFDYLRENQDEYGFTPDQKKELFEGVPDMNPNWGDFALFPLTGRSVAHDK